jgi:hypothetical protein
MVAIVSHDAGGAELLSSWASNQSEPFCLVPDGPAKSIFKRKLGTVKILPLDQAIQKADWVLCGTSWQSDLERIAIVTARENGKKVVSFIDHWVNYTERFILNDALVLPDEIWIADQDAKGIALKLFPGTPILLVDNPYFAELATELDKIRSSAGKDDQGILLYVCEPIREHALIQHADERFWGYTEEEALKFFLDNTDVLSSSIREIRVRPHPSEDPEKYLWSTANTNQNVVISRKESLLEEIVSAEIIIGCESMAMVVGLLANKRVVSSIPPGGKICGLPHSGIEHLQELLNNPFKIEHNA